MVSIFVESGLGASRKDTDSAKTFLAEQIKTFEAKLEEAETRLKEFRLRNLGTQSADGKDTASRLVEISGQLEAARLQLREAENARDAAKQQLAAERGQGGGSSVTQSLLQESALSVSTPEIDSRLDAQKRNLDGAAAALHRPAPRRAERAPADQGTGRPEEARSGRTARTAMMTQTASPSGGNSSLASQELARMLATSEVQVASLAGTGLGVRRPLCRGPRVAEAGAADRSRGGAAQPRLRHHEEEL